MHTLWTVRFFIHVLLPAAATRCHWLPVLWPLTACLQIPSCRLYPAHCRRFAAPCAFRSQCSNAYHPRPNYALDALSPSSYPHSLAVRASLNPCTHDPLPHRPVPCQHNPSSGLFCQSSPPRRPHSLQQRPHGRCSSTGQQRHVWLQPTHRAGWRVWRRPTCPTSAWGGAAAGGGGA